MNTNININNARLNAMKESYENAYDNIYTFNIYIHASIYFIKNKIPNNVYVCKRINIYV